MGGTFGVMILMPTWALLANTHGWRTGYTAIAVSSLLLAAVAWRSLHSLERASDAEHLVP